MALVHVDSKKRVALGRILQGRGGRKYPLSFRIRKEAKAKARAKG